MRKERGQGLVEFALVLMFIILPFTFVFIETAMLIFALNNVTNAAREGARQGSIYTYRDDRPNPYGCFPFDPLQVDAVYGFDCWRYGFVVDYLSKDPVGRTRFVDTCEITLDYLEPYKLGNTYRELQPLKLDLTCPHRLLFGIVGESYITLTATSTMKIEPGSGIP